MNKEAVYTGFVADLRLDYLANLPPTAFYNGEVLAELYNMQSAKAFSVFSWRKRKLLRKTLLLLEGIEAPVFQIIQGLVEGTVTFRTEWNFILKKSEVTLPDGDGLTITVPHEDDFLGYGYRDFPCWMTYQEALAISDCIEELAALVEEKEERKERQRICGLFDKEDPVPS